MIFSLPLHLAEMENRFKSKCSYSRSSNTSVSFLAGSVPDLGLETFAIHFYSSAQHKQKSIVSTAITQDHLKWTVFKVCINNIILFLMFSLSNY